MDKLSGDLLAPERISALRSQPGFSAAVEACAAADLVRYRSLPPVERWMVSDVGRTSLSGAAVVLEALDRLTPSALLSSRPVLVGEVSRGRARLYLQRAMANQLIVAIDREAPLSRSSPLTITPRFRRVMTGVFEVALPIASTLLPDAASGLDRLSDFAFMRRVSASAGLLFARSDLFPIESPIRLFQNRDGGARVLEALIVRQAPDRERFLEVCGFSHSELSRAGMCSRAHVINLLRDAATGGLLSIDGRRMTISRALSEDVERYFASFFTVACAAMTLALAEG